MWSAWPFHIKCQRLKNTCTTVWKCAGYTEPGHVNAPNATGQDTGGHSRNTRPTAWTCDTQCTPYNRLQEIYKVRQKQCRTHNIHTPYIQGYTTRNSKFSFTSRIAPMWNSLPDSVVSANTIYTFKILLDRFWFDQDIKYNWKADIHTGSRSQVDVILI